MNSVQLSKLPLNSSTFFALGSSPHSIADIFISYKESKQVMLSSKGILLVERCWLSRHIWCFLSGRPIAAVWLPLGLSLFFGTSANMTSVKSMDNKSLVDVSSVIFPDGSSVEFIKISSGSSWSSPSLSSCNISYSGARFFFWVFFLWMCLNIWYHLHIFTNKDLFILKAGSAKP